MPSKTIQEYQRMFKIPSLPFLLSDIYVNYYIDLSILIIFDNDVWTSYLPKEVLKKTSLHGEQLYTDPVAFNEYRLSFEKYKEDVLALKEELFCKKTLSGKDVSHFLLKLSDFFSFYSKTEFFYLDSVFAKTNKSKIATTIFDEFSTVKNSGREFLNSLFFGSSSYLNEFLSLFSKQVAVDVEFLLRCSIVELVDLCSGLNPDIDAVLARKKFVMDSSTSSILFNDEAKIFLDAFFGDYNVSNSIKGTIANKGKVSGRVKVISLGYDNFDLVDSFIAEMDEGEILVAETTSPELFSACSKASAILTNQGGLLSHAAIVSRELGIPCIVGLQNITELVIDNDFVEVDANKGTVRIIK